MNKEQIQLIFTGPGLYNRTIIDHAENMTVAEVEELQKINAAQGRPEMEKIRRTTDEPTERFRIIPETGPSGTTYLLMDYDNKYGPYDLMTEACLKQLEISANEGI